MQTPSSPTPSNNLLLSHGYGYIPKAVMTDRSLPPTAKALYAYLCSFTGRDGKAWPSVERICDDLAIGKTAFRSAMNRLVGAGYVSIDRVKERGRFSHSVYTLGGGMAAEGTGADAPGTDYPAAEASQPGNWAANNTTPDNTTPNNTLDEDDDRASLRMRAHAQPSKTGKGVQPMPENDRRVLERRRVAAMAAAMPYAPGGGKAAGRQALRLGFAECYSRPPLAAEADMLAELLDQCEAPALLRLIRSSAEHAPGSPAPYVRRMAQKYRSDAVAYGLLARPFEKLSEEILDRVDAKNDGFACIGGHT